MAVIVGGCYCSWWLLQLVVIVGGCDVGYLQYLHGGSVIWTHDGPKTHVFRSFT